LVFDDTFGAVQARALQSCAAEPFAVVGRRPVRRRRSLWVFDDTFGAVQARALQAYRYHRPMTTKGAQ